jgi:hypothetical protein
LREFHQEQDAEKKCTQDGYQWGVFYDLTF